MIVGQFPERVARLNSNETLLGREVRCVAWTIRGCVSGHHTPSTASVARSADSRLVLTEIALILFGKRCFICAGSDGSPRTTIAALLMTRLAQPLDETSVLHSFPSLVETHKLASPSAGCAPLSNVPIMTSASATCVGPSCLPWWVPSGIHRCECLLKIQRNCIPSGFAWATLPRRMTETDSSLKVCQPRG